MVVTGCYLEGCPGDVHPAEEAVHDVTGEEEHVLVTPTLEVLGHVEHPVNHHHPHVGGDLRLDLGQTLTVILIFCHHYHHLFEVVDVHVTKHHVFQQDGVYPQS